jgi:glycosyltransferase involved in cell wall biosynthesis
MNPLVSAIMPTRGRREFAHSALCCYLNQSYSEKELVICDDEDNPSFEESRIESLRACGWQVQYTRVDPGKTIAAKRNRCCRMATGEIIIHFDSDDWSSTDRIADQVERMKLWRKAVSGYHSMLFYDAAAGSVAKYESNAAYALGTSLCYSKQFWSLHPFNEYQRIEEDNTFVGDARNAHQLISVDAGLQMVARIHDDNTAPKPIERYMPQTLEALPELFPR